MEVTIDIIDRTYAQIKEMCDFNGISVEEYVLNCVEDNFNILKYGDLNEKFFKKDAKMQEENIVTKAVAENKEEVPKKKVGRPRKVKKEETIIKTPQESEAELTEKGNTFIKEQEVTDTVDTELQNKIKRTKRTLKTK